MHPGGVVEGMESAAAQEHIELAPGQIDQVVSRSSSLDAVERLEIYARAYYARLVECLEAEFPILARAVGEELFREFAVGYLECYPSRSYTLNHLGARFADYLAETFPAGENDSPGGAFLIDLARLEWVFNEVFDGPGVENATLLGPEQLAGVEPERWADVRLVPVPCLRVLKLDHPVHDYYRALRADAEVPPPRRRHPLGRDPAQLRRAALSARADAICAAGSDFDGRDGWASDRKRLGARRVRPPAAGRPTSGVVPFLVGRGLFPRRRVSSGRPCCRRSTDRRLRHIRYDPPSGVSVGCDFCEPPSFPPLWLLRATIARGCVSADRGVETWEAWRRAQSKLSSVHRLTEKKRTDTACNSKTST